MTVNIAPEDLGVDGISPDQGGVGGKYKLKCGMMEDLSKAK
ncbi:MAG: hypothetical protein ACRCZO_02370 [Cetobacterium sp.]